MRLYLIKRCSDQKFFVTINGYYALHLFLLTRSQRFMSGVDGVYWSGKPQTFLKTADGVAGNLRKLCSEPYWQTEAPDGVKIKDGWRELGWRNFDEEKLLAYEVVAMDVDVLSTTSTPATEFIQIEAIANKPLNRFERHRPTQEPTDDQ